MDPDDAIDVENLQEIQKRILGRATCALGGGGVANTKSEVYVACKIYLQD